MQALIFFFFDLCLLRRAPQDLPASDAVFTLAAVASLLVGVLVSLVDGQSLLIGAIQSLAQLVLLLAILHFGLKMMRLRGRFLQSATALLGTGVLLSLLALVPISLSPGETSGEGLSLAALSMLLLFAWSILVAGHILRHTLGVTFGQGVAIAVLYDLLSFSLFLLGSQLLAS